MANTLTESLSRSIQPQQSILPLRRERTITNRSLNRNSKPIYSEELPKRSSTFSAEKQYDRRQSSSQVRSAKSDEVFRLIDRRLVTGVHGVRLLFRSNDPKQEGTLSKEAFRRVLTQLCGYINAEEWEKVCKLFHLNERSGTITFEEFLSYFPDNEKVKRELSLAQQDHRSSALLTLSQNITSSRQSSQQNPLTKLTANYCFFLMKTRCRDPSFSPNDYIPYDCLNGGVITREHLKTILTNFQFTDLLSNETEFENLWSKFDLNNAGFVRTNVFLRLLDYRTNLADEINADIQRLVSRSSAAGMIERTTSSPSKKPRQLSRLSAREINQSIQQTKISPPPTTTIEQTESQLAESSQDSLDKELSTKFRTIVQQHRRMMKQLNENDEFALFLDRKVNEGYFCLKTVFSYLDPKQTNMITKDQLIAALNQFDIPLSQTNITQFLQKHHLTPSNDQIDYNSFLKHFQDRSDTSFLARALSAFGKSKSQTNKSELEQIESGLVDLLHHLFLSLTAAFKYISSTIDDLCPENEFFIILKKELSIPDNYRFTDKQKNEIYVLLNTTDEMKEKKQLPYKRILYYLSKVTMPTNKEYNIIEKKDNEKSPKLAPRKLVAIEKSLNDLVRLRMHTFVKVFSRIDQPRTEKINHEQFYEVLQQMGSDLTQSEVDIFWTSSGFQLNKTMPFPNLIRQIIIFNRDENRLLLNQLQRSQSIREREVPFTGRSSTSTSTRSLYSSGNCSQMSTSSSQAIDSHEVYQRILPYIRLNYNRIKNDLLDNDPLATGLIDFPILLDIFQHYKVPINETELGVLIRLDNPRNGSKVQYPFFIRKYHSDGPVIKISPYQRVHPIYEQLIQKQHTKNPNKEHYDQRIQNPRDLKYLIRLFTNFDKSRKGFLTHDEFHSLLQNNGIQLSKSDEDFYQLFSKYDRQLSDQFKYFELFRTIIQTIMS